MAQLKTKKRNPRMFHTTNLNYQQIAEGAKYNVANDSTISQKNKDDLNRYLNALELKVKPARVAIIIRQLKRIFEILPDVVGTMNDRDKVNQALKQFKQFKIIRKNKKGKIISERPISDGYYETVKQVGKAFVRWHNDGETPKGWKDIKSIKKAQNRKLTPGDMITWEDGQRLADSTNSVQLKAAILTQLDAGLRPSEFMHLTYGDIEIKKIEDKIIGVIHVADGKTGERYVIINKSLLALQAWLKAHPTRNKKDRLWIQEAQHKGNVLPYRYEAIRNRIIDLGKKINLNKPLDFYSLRHSSCYLDKMDNLDVEQAAKRHGHSVKYYTETYARLSTEDDIKKYKKHYDSLKDDKNTHNLNVVCARCNQVNEPIKPDDLKKAYCSLCQAPLNIQTAIERSNEVEQLVAKDDEYRKRQEALEEQVFAMQTILKRVHLIPGLVDHLESATVSRREAMTKAIVEKSKQ